MSIRFAFFTLFYATLLGSRTLGEESPAQEHSLSPAPLAVPDIANMLRATHDLRLASEALAQFGKSLEQITPKVAEATVATSREMSAMSAAFDPFGFKTSYQVISEQNKIIREQNEIIRQLQQAEIVRLKMELQKLRKSGGRQGGNDAVGD